MKTHQKIRPDDVEKDDNIVMKLEVREGTMRVYFKLKHRTDRDDRPDGWMCEIKEITLDGKTMTEEYIKSAFDGERTRGIPDEKWLKADNIEVIA